jgi:hypothetical protein
MTPSGRLLFLVGGAETARGHFDSEPTAFLIVYFSQPKNAQIKLIQVSRVIFS